MFWEKSTRVGGVLLIAACLFVLTGFSPSLMASNNGTFSAAHFFPFGNPSDLSVPGGATLLRTNRALSMSASVTGLTPGAVYTIWWIIFNNPKACQNPLGEFSACSDLDFPNPRVGAAIVLGSGNNRRFQRHGQLCRTAEEGQASRWSLRSPGGHSPTKKPQRSGSASSCSGTPRSSVPPWGSRYCPDHSLWWMWRSLSKCIRNDLQPTLLGDQERAHHCLGADAPSHRGGAFRRTFCLQDLYQLKANLRRMAYIEIGR